MEGYPRCTHCGQKVQEIEVENWTLKFEGPLEGCDSATHPETGEKVPLETVHYIRVSLTTPSGERREQACVVERMVSAQTMKLRISRYLRKGMEDTMTPHLIVNK